MKKKIDKDLVVLLIVIVIGILLRIVFNLMIGVIYYQYDIGIKTIEIDNLYEKILDENEDVVIKHGQLDYIIHLFKYNKLLDGTNYQAYHPPLNFFVFAMALKIFNVFLISAKMKLELLKIIPVAYSIIFVLVFYKILKEIKFSKKEMVIPFLFISYWPIFVVAGRLINNDLLMTIFSMLTLLYLMKWDKDESYKNAILGAICFGLGGMTKTSILVMIIPMIYIIGRHFIKIDVDKDLNKIWKYLFQILIVIVISGTLIMWYQIRNMKEYGVGLFSIVESKEELQIRDKSIYDRWLINKEFFDNTLRDDSSNIYSYVLNSSLITLTNKSITEKEILLPIKVLLTISIIGIIIGMFKKIEHKGLLITTWFSWIGGFVLFNVKYPASCTMHARYILLTFIISIIFFENYIRNIKNNNFKLLIKIMLVLMIALFMIININYLTLILNEIK